ncbi:MAG: diguanylate cyclase [Gammaproteobacteria bacterium]
MTTPRSSSKKTRLQLTKEIYALPLDAQQLHTLLEGAPIMLWMTDEKGEVNYFNEKWLAFTGLSRDDALGDAWVKSLHPEDKQRCLDDYSAAFKAHHTMEMEYRIKRFDGEYRWVLDKGEPCFCRDGRFMGFAGCTLDITERKQAEESLRISHEELTRSNRDIAMLSEMNDYLQACNTVVETYPVLSHYAGRLFTDNPGALSMINASRSLVEIIVAWGGTATGEKVFTQSDCWALRHGKLHLMDDPVDGLLCMHLTERPQYGYMCVPLIAYGDVMGILHLQFSANRTARSDAEMKNNMKSTRRLAVTAAEHLALALANIKLREDLRFQSVRDPLTRLYNRRYMMASLEREVCRARRQQTSVGVVMIDIDHFKRYNDTYGHEAGDLVLSELGTFLMKQIRGDDIPCRYGGEEFMLVLPEAPMDILIQRAQELRQGATLIKLVYKGQRLGTITISLGVACFPVHGVTAEALLNAADTALYRAKKEGRDRVIVAEPVNDHSDIQDPKLSG